MSCCSLGRVHCVLIIKGLAAQIPASADHMSEVSMDETLNRDCFQCGWQQPAIDA